MVYKTIIISNCNHQFFVYKLNKVGKIYPLVLVGYEIIISPKVRSKEFIHKDGRHERLIVIIIENFTATMSIKYQ